MDFFAIFDWIKQNLSVLYVYLYTYRVTNNRYTIRVYSKTNIKYELIFAFKLK